MQKIEKKHWTTTRRTNKLKSQADVKVNVKQYFRQCT